MAQIADRWPFDTIPKMPIALVAIPPQSWVQLNTDPANPEVLGVADLLNWAAVREGKERNSCPHYRQPQHRLYLGEYTKEQLAELNVLMRQYESDGSVKLTLELLNAFVRWYDKHFPKCPDWRQAGAEINDEGVVDRFSTYASRHLTPFEFVAALVLCNGFGIRIEAEYTSWRA